MPALTLLRTLLRRARRDRRRARRAALPWTAAAAGVVGLAATAFVWAPRRRRRSFS